ncbi:hypothetical protein F4678DRAFT_421818 [Xylaria arbuscula]|nr:hypothetical protein F4678DRAFT_421818 [Xylaria arbuscula]
MPPHSLHTHTENNYRNKPYVLIRAGVLGPVEAIPAAACSLIASCYTIQKEPIVPVDDFGTLIRITSSLFPDIGHGLLFVSCLVFGCCVSSYKHRMQRREPYQGAVFLMWVTWVGLVARGYGSDRDTVIVGIIPWALVAAMLSSYLGHALLSRRKVDVMTLTVDQGGSTLC